MKTLITTALLLAFTIINTFAQDLSGVWHGNAKGQDSKEILFVFLFEKNQDGYVSKMAIPTFDVMDILNHQEANPPQKTKNLMNRLSRKYMPRSSHAADEFKRFAASMHLPQNVSVDHTPFFEDDSVTLSITFSNRESVQNAWEKIKRAVRNQGN